MKYEDDRFQAALSAAWNPLTDFKSHKISHLRSNAPFDKKWAWPEVEGPYYEVFLAKLEPGGFVIPHIDAGGGKHPFRDRWHIPLQPAGYFWEDGVYYEPTRPFHVSHWLPHAVWNPTDTTRIHIIVDRLETVKPEPAETNVVLTDMIPEIQEMVDALDVLHQA